MQKFFTKRRTLLITLLSPFVINASEMHEGEVLYNKLGCNACHGPMAEGTNIFPKLANQDEFELVLKMKVYRSKKLNTQRFELMAPFARTLTNLQIDALANYLANIDTGAERERYILEYDNEGGGGS